MNGWNLYLFFQSLVDLGGLEERRDGGVKVVGVVEGSFDLVDGAALGTKENVGAEGLKF